MLNTFLQTRKWQALALAGIILLLYARSLPYGFIGMDEQSLLIEKKGFNSKLSNIPKAFSQHVFQYEDYTEGQGSIKFYRPMLTVSFILDAQFSKDGFTMYHFTNILLHFLAVLGLLFVLLQLNLSPPLSFFFALLFAVHPLLTQAIAWIPGRNDSMACVFVLLSFYFLLKQLRIPSATNLILHLLLLACALFTKENTVMFIVLCTFYMFLLNKGAASSKKIVLLGSYGILAAVWYFARLHAVGEIKTDTSAEALYDSFQKNFPLILQYFQKTILPVNLSVMASVKDTQFGWVLLALALLGAGIYFTKNIPWADILFGLLWFLLFLLPTLLFSYFEGMEHRSYLPAIGILLAAAHLDPVRKLDPSKTLMLLGSVVLVFTALTFTRLPIFKDELSYWESAAASSKHSAVVCRDYGVILTQKGKYKEAEQAYFEGIRRNPKESLLHYNLGVMYYKMGRLEEARAQLAQEMGITPSNFMIYHVMGVIYKQENRIEEAVTMWEQAVALHPGFDQSYKELLSYYSQIQDKENFLRCKAALEKAGYQIVKKK